MLATQEALESSRAQCEKHKSRLDAVEEKTLVELTVLRHTIAALEADKREGIPKAHLDTALEEV